MKLEISRWEFSQYREISVLLQHDFVRFCFFLTARKTFRSRKKAKAEVAALWLADTFSATPHAVIGQKFDMYRFWGLQTPGPCLKTNGDVLERGESRIQRKDDKFQISTRRSSSEGLRRQNWEDWGPLGYVWYLDLPRTLTFKLDATQSTRLASPSSELPAGLTDTVCDHHLLRLHTFVVPRWTYASLR